MFNPADTEGLKMLGAALLFWLGLSLMIKDADDNQTKD